MRKRKLLSLVMAMAMVLSLLPASELRRIRQEYIDKYYPGFAGEEGE